MYLIRKEGLWLIGHRPSEIKEFVNGQLADVQTAIWGSDRRDAKTYAVRASAAYRADLLGGEVVYVSGKKAKKEESENGMDESDR